VNSYANMRLGAINDPQLQIDEMLSHYGCFNENLLRIWKRWDQNALPAPMGGMMDRNNEIGIICEQLEPGTRVSIIQMSPIAWKPVSTSASVMMESKMKAEWRRQRAEQHCQPSTQYAFNRK